MKAKANFNELSSEWPYLIFKYTIIQFMFVVIIPFFMMPKAGAEDFWEGNETDMM